MPTESANASTLRSPRWRVPRLPPSAPSRLSSISAKKLFDGTLVSSISLATVGEATAASGLPSQRPVGQVRVSDPPVTRTPRLRSALFSSLAATSSGARA